MDYETRGALEGAQAASEALLERDLADLELLRKIRGRPLTARRVLSMLAEEASDLRPFVAGGNAPLSTQLLETLDDLIKLLGGEQ
jgi:hypothetical protein